jgi:hypothetical protein
VGGRVTWLEERCGERPRPVFDLRRLTSEDIRHRWHALTFVH